MKILVMKFRNIGDVLLTSPLFANLRHHYPDARIDAAVNAGTEAMLTDNPHIDHIHVYDRERIHRLPLHKRSVEEWRFAHALRRERYDLVINTTEGDRGAFLARYSGAPITVGYRPKKNRFLQHVFTYELPSQGMRHTLETNLDPLRILGKEIVTKRVSIHWNERDQNRIENFMKERGLKKGKFIHFHPVSRWLFKCIDDRIAAEIIDFCQETLGYPVVLSAAPVKSELDKIAAIKKLCSSEPVDLSGCLTLKETASLNSFSTLFIGVDTAIMHIAAANDIPVLSFFGPSGAFHWGPWDNALDQSGYTQRNGIQQMGKHTVYALNWECIPCGQDGCEGSKISDCLMELSTQTIHRLIEEKLS